MPRRLAASAWAPASSWREIRTASGPIVAGRASGVIRCWPCHIAAISGVLPAMKASRSAGAVVNRLAMTTSGGPGRRDEVRLDQTMQVGDEIARLGVVDGLLRLGPPGGFRALVVRIEADDVDFGDIAELVAVERLEFAPENEVQPLRLFRRFGLGFSKGRHQGPLMQAPGFAVARE